MASENENFDVPAILATLKTALAVADAAPASAAELADRRREIANELQLVGGADLRDVPLVILFESDFAGGILNGNIGGVTSLFAGELVGDRRLSVAMILEDQRTKRENGLSWQKILLAIAIHEMAHSLDSDRCDLIRRLQLAALQSPSPSPDRVAASRAEMKAYAACVRREWNQDAGRWLELKMHDQAFIRAALHAHQKSTLYRAPAELIHDTSNYGLSSIREYQRALGSELDPRGPFVEKTFAEIRAIAPPPAFCELWNSDLRACAARWGVPPADFAGYLLKGQTVTTILANVADKIAAARAARAEAFNQLVDDIVGGLEPATKRVELSLSSSEKTLDDLRVAVTAKESRLAAQARLAELPAKRARLAELSGRVAIEDGKVHAAMQQRAAVFMEVTGEAGALQEALNREGNDRVFLENSATDPGALSTHATARDAYNSAVRKQAAAVKARDANRNWAAYQMQETFGSGRRPSEESERMRKLFEEAVAELEAFKISIPLLKAAAEESVEGLRQA